ncbi:MAG TPA: hypothetical protein DIW23_05795 [Anaerolineae bacterium]|nr:hypothetical protein [Anaerolineae bacterium]HRK98733.1 hypothetical protein [Alphaproteobacteria bacterium]
MNDTQLKRSIQSVGMKCFVKYFEHFLDSTIKNDELVELLMKNEGWIESGCKTRVAQAKRIINHGKSKDALKIIVNSSKIDAEINLQAKELLANNNVVQSRG